MQQIVDRDIHQILQETQNKKVILYGVGNFARDLIEKLRCLDIAVSYCVDDDFVDVRVDKPVKDVYSLLLEIEDIFVVIAKEDVQRCTVMLEGMGFQYLKEYNDIFSAGNPLEINPEDTFSLDPLFGYSMPWKQTSGTGIRIVGKMESTYKIAILGGSTSDPCAYPWKSWGELFYEKCSQEGRDVCVIIGGIAGYASGQELIKLIRDILPLNPDLVISLSGVNDYSGNSMPYIHGYLRQIYNRLVSAKPEGRYSGIPEKVSYGLQQNGLTAIDNWIRNQQIMHAITKEFHIQYVAFAQPNLITKKHLPGGKDEETLFYVDENIVRERKVFLKELKEHLEDKPYIIDATQWFDDTDGLFHDHCHVIEEGNQLIANNVYDYIFCDRNERMQE